MSVPSPGFQKMLDAMIKNLGVTAVKARTQRAPEPTDQAFLEQMGVILEDTVRRLELLKRGEI